MFDRNVLALDETGLAQALEERGKQMLGIVRRAALIKPIIGVTCCCARITVGHTAAAPNKIMNFRLLTFGPLGPTVA